MKERHYVPFWEGLNEGLGSIQNNPKTHWAYGKFLEKLISIELRSCDNVEFVLGIKDVIILEHMCCHDVLDQMLLASTTEPMTCTMIVTYLYTWGKLEIGWISNMNLLPNFCMFAIANVDGFKNEFSKRKWGTRLNVFVWITK
jgi:hypothetical protein